jgi:glycosyltransferase involved in cell wall biosynthesis
MLHVAQISFLTDPQRRAPARLLADWPSLVDIAEAAARADIRVSVVQACAHSQLIMRNGVRYHFLPFGRGAATSRHGAATSRHGAATSRHGAATFGHGAAKAASRDAFADLLRTLAPDVLHVHGLGFACDVLALRAAAPGIPILLQDHASRPPRWWRRPLWRRAFAAASGISFCALEQAEPFTRAGLIAARTKLYEIPESTSRFAPGNPAAIRRGSEALGCPAVLWVGHLDANKDPLTVLEGIREAARSLPQLQLWCCFGRAPLLRAVQRRIAVDPLLRDRVRLLGRVLHSQVEQLMRAADVFVLGSHREGSGYSLIEALACGLPPVVTDIPSFRSLTGGGKVGALWKTGDARQLCARLLAVAAQPRAQLRAAARAHFDRELSFDAVGRKLAAAYHDLRDGREQLAAVYHDLRVGRHWGPDRVVTPTTPKETVESKRRPTGSLAHREPGGSPYGQIHPQKRLDDVEP